MGASNSPHIHGTHVPVEESSRPRPRFPATRAVLTAIRISLTGAEKPRTKLINLLDMTDPSLNEREGPDSDLEPSLGGGDGRDLEEDRADEEPSLGWPEQFDAGEGGPWGGQDDREVCLAVR